MKIERKFKLCMPLNEGWNGGNFGTPKNNGNRTGKDKPQNVDKDGTEYDGKGGTVTEQTIENEAPDWLDRDVEQNLIKIKPYEAPLDAIARLYGKNEKTVSLEPEAGSISIIPYKDNTAANFTVPSTIGKGVVDITVESIDIWAKGDTLAVVKYGIENIVFFVTDIDYRAKKLSCVFLGEDGAGTEIPKGTLLHRMGAAANERQMMLEGREPLPDFRTNYCQRFLATVSVGAIEELHGKVARYNFNDRKYDGVENMKRDIESSFLFSVKSKFLDPNEQNKQVRTCAGVWSQMENTFVCPETIDDKTFIELTEHSFTGNNGSKTKILLAGHGLISQFMKGANYQKTIAQGNVEYIAGIKFNRIETSHGSLLVRTHDLFLGAHNNDGIIIDPDYISKKYYKTFNTVELDLQKSGIDNSENVSMEEISTIFLHNLPVHTRIVGNENWL